MYHHTNNPGAFPSVAPAPRPHRDVWPIPSCHLWGFTNSGPWGLHQFGLCPPPPSVELVQYHVAVKDNTVPYGCWEHACWEACCKPPQNPSTPRLCVCVRVFEYGAATTVLLLAVMPNLLFGARVLGATHWLAPAACPPGDAAHACALGQDIVTGCARARERGQAGPLRQQLRRLCAHGQLCDGRRRQNEPTCSRRGRFQCLGALGNRPDSTPWSAYCSPDPAVV